MKKILIGVLMLFPAVLFAAEEVDETRAAEKDGYVTIKVVRGKVDVVGWDRAEVRVRGTLDEKTEEFVFRVDDEHTLIDVRLKDGDSEWFSRSRGSELTIHVPEDSDVEFGGVSSDFTAEGVEGELDVSVVSGDVEAGPGEGDADLNSVSGDITVKGRKNRVEAQSVSGDVFASDITGPGEFVSVSGDLILENVGTELELQTISGDISVRTTELGETEGQSVSGDIEVRGALGKEGSIDLESMSGSIELSLDGEVDARFTLETGSGSIRNRLTDDEPEVSKYMRNENLRFTVGKGSVHVDIGTHSGDITVDSQ